MTTAVSNLSTPETAHADSSRPIGWLGIASTALLVGAPAAAQANVFVQPNLPVGSAYRLIFLTSSQTDGSSPDIAVYNTMVTNAAANNPLLPAATWRAIVSTPTVNAIDNIACTPSCSSDPIYLVTGSEVATSTADLFDGTVLTPISITESGSTTGMYYTYTGSQTDGTAYTGAELGNGSISKREGYAGFTTGGLYLSYRTAAESDPIYAISSELIVDIPAPGGLPAVALGGLATLAARVVRRRRRT